MADVVQQGGGDHRAGGAGPDGPPRALPRVLSQGHRIAGVVHASRPGQEAEQIVDDVPHAPTVRFRMVPAATVAGWTWRLDDRSMHMRRQVTIRVGGGRQCGGAGTGKGAVGKAAEANGRRVRGHAREVRPRLPFRWGSEDNSETVGELARSPPGQRGRPSGCICLHRPIRSVRAACSVSAAGDGAGLVLRDRRCDHPPRSGPQARLPFLARVGTDLSVPMLPASSRTVVFPRWYVMGPAGRSLA